VTRLFSTRRAGRSSSRVRCIRRQWVLKPFEKKALASMACKTYSDCGLRSFAASLTPRLARGLGTSGEPYNMPHHCWISVDDRSVYLPTVVHLQFTQRVVRGVAASERIYSYNTKVLYTAIYSLHLTIILVYLLVRRASQPLKLPLSFLQPREWHHDSTSDLIAVHSSYSPLPHAFPLTQCYPQRVRCI
jgi:hypothetical protein